MARITNKQLLTDLTILHGSIYNREGYDPAYAKSLAIATRRLFPKSTLSQAMQKDLEE